MEDGAGPDPIDSLYSAIVPFHPVSFLRLLHCAKETRKGRGDHKENGPDFPTPVPSFGPPRVVVIRLTASDLL